MKGGAGSVVFEWRRSVARTVLKLGILFVVVLLVATAIGSDVNIKKPDKTVKIEQRDAKHARAADPTPTATPPAAKSAAHDWSVVHFLKGIGLIVIIICLILWVGIPLLGAGVFWAGHWWDEATDAHDDRKRQPERQQRLRDRTIRQQEKERARLTRDAELLRLRNEVARLKREGKAPMLRGQQMTAENEQMDSQPHSTNGSTNGTSPPVA